MCSGFCDFHDVEAAGAKIQRRGHVEQKVSLLGGFSPFGRKPGVRSLLPAPRLSSVPGFQALSSPGGQPVPLDQ